MPVGHHHNHQTVKFKEAALEWAIPKDLRGPYFIKYILSHPMGSSSPMKEPRGKP